MNVHHLELFYFVAKHEGITNAVRNIPYGIQQPAVSMQISQLEEDLDTTFCHRRPFVLTVTGERLFRFIEPFFSQLDKVADDLRGGESQRVRVGASQPILSDHMPWIMERVRASKPYLRVSLRQGHQRELEAALLAREIDIAVTLFEKEPPAGVEARALIEIPLALVVKRSSKIKSAEQLFSSGKVEEPLICLPEGEPVQRHFREGLQKAGVDWHTGLEVNSFDLAEKFAAQGFGIGLTVVSPSSKRVPGVRDIPLQDFPTLKVGVLWQGKLDGGLKAFVDSIESHAEALKSSLT